VQGQEPSRAHLWGNVYTSKQIAITIRSLNKRTIWITCDCRCSIPQSICNQAGLFGSLLPVSVSWVNCLYLP